MSKQIKPSRHSDLAGRSDRFMTWRRAMCQATQPKCEAKRLVQSSLLESPGLELYYRAGSRRPCRKQNSHQVMGGCLLAVYMFKAARKNKNSQAAGGNVQCLTSCQTVISIPLTTEAFRLEGFASSHTLSW